MKNYLKKLCSLFVMRGEQLSSRDSVVSVVCERIIYVWACFLVGGGLGVFFRSPRGPRRVTASFFGGILWV